MGKTKDTPKARKVKTKTIPWDAVEYLKNEENMANYLEAAFEEGDPSLVAAALGDVARAKGMSQIAEAAGLGPREPLQSGICHDSESRAGAWPSTQGERLTS